MVNHGLSLYVFVLFGHQLQHPQRSENGLNLNIYTGEEKIPKEGLEC
jgi:hypothetical protein